MGRTTTAQENAYDKSPLPPATVYPPPQHQQATPQHPLQNQSPFGVPVDHASQQQQQQQAQFQQYPPQTTQNGAAYGQASQTPTGYGMNGPGGQGPYIGQTPVRPPISYGTTPWSSGLFDCMEDPNNAIMTLLFPCVTFGQIAEIIDTGHTSCGTSGLIYGAVAFLTTIPCIISFGYRSKLRVKYNLVESPAPDWLTHCICENFALCQEYRELKHYGLDPSIGWYANQAMIQNGQQGVAMVPPMNQRMA